MKDFVERQLRLHSFNLTVLAPRVQRLNRSDEQPMGHRMLGYDAILWLSFGHELAYFDAVGAEQTYREHVEIVLGNWEHVVGASRELIPTPIIEWLARIARGGLRGRGVSFYDGVPLAVKDVLRSYLQTAFLLLSGATSREDGIASHWAKLLMFADDSAWGVALNSFEPGKPKEQNNQKLCDEALSLIRYMSSSIDLLNAASQDPRLTELMHHVFSADLALLLAWPLNLSVERIRLRFLGLSEACLSAAESALVLPAGVGTTAKRELTNLAYTWSELVTGAPLPAEA